MFVCFLKQTDCCENIPAAGGCLYCAYIIMCDGRVTLFTFFFA